MPLVKWASLAIIASKHETNDQCSGTIFKVMIRNYEQKCETRDPYMAEYICQSHGNQSVFQIEIRLQILIFDV